MALGEEAELNRVIVPHGWEPIHPGVPENGYQAAMVLDMYAKVTPADLGFHDWTVYDGANRAVAMGSSRTVLAAKLAAVEAVRTMTRGKV